MKDMDKELIAYLERLLTGLGIEYSISADEDRPEWDYQLVLPDLGKRFFITVKKAVYPQTVREKSALASMSFSVGIPRVWSITGMVFIMTT